MSLPLLQVESRFFNHPARGKVQCFLTSILQKIVRRSAGSRGIIIKTKNPETAKNSKYLSNNAVFFSGNWQHWSTLRAQPTASLFVCLFVKFAFKAAFSSTACFHR